MFAIFIRAVLVASHFEVAVLRTRKGDSRKGRFLIVMLRPKPRQEGICDGIQQKVGISVIVVNMPQKWGINVILANMQRKVDIGVILAGNSLFSSQFPTLLPSTLHTQDISRDFGSA